MSYIGKSPTGSGVRTRYYFTATGGETSLSGADDGGKTLKFTDGEYVDVYLNGVALVAGTDYGTSTANTISGLDALTAGDIAEIVVYDIYNIAKINTEAQRIRHYFTAAGGETSIGTSQIPGLSFAANAEIEVKLNGVSLVQGTDYNTSSANTVGGLTALTAGQVVEIVIYEKFQLADTVSKSQGGTFNGIIFTPERPAILAQGSNEANVSYANGAAITSFTTDGTHGSFAKGISIVSNTRFTVPVAGKYYVNASVYFNDSSTSIRLQIAQNGSVSNPNGQLSQSGAGAARTVNVTAVLDLAANDYIEFTNQSGGSRTVYNGSNHTYVSMFLIG